VVPTAILLNMIASQYAVKLIIAACDTPFVYLGAKLLKSEVRISHILQQNLSRFFGRLGTART